MTKIVWFTVLGTHNLRSLFTSRRGLNYPTIVQVRTRVQNSWKGLYFPLSMGVEFTKNHIPNLHGRRQSQTVVSNSHELLTHASDASSWIIPSTCARTTYRMSIFIPSRWSMVSHPFPDEWSRVIIWRGRYIDHKPQIQSATYTTHYLMPCRAVNSRLFDARGQMCDNEETPFHQPRNSRIIGAQIFFATPLFIFWYYL